MKRKRTAENVKLFYSIRSSGSKILSYLAPVQLFTQLPRQTPTHSSLRWNKPFLTLPQSMHEGSLNSDNLPLNQRWKQNKKKTQTKNLKEKILIKCVLNSLSAIFQKILLHTWQIYAGIIKLTQEVRSLKDIFELTSCSVILFFPSPLCHAVWICQFLFGRWLTSRNSFKLERKLTLILVTFWKPTMKSVL